MKRNSWFLFALVLTILLAIVTRFIYLTKTPGWYPDEGVNLTIAANLFHGRLSEEVVRYSFMPHPPLAFILSLPFILVVGPKLLAMRLLSSIASLVTILIIYQTGKQLKDRWLGLLSAFVYTIFPVAIVVGRYGLTYQVLSMFFALFVLFLLRHFQKQRDTDLMFAALAASAASVTSLFGLAAVLTVCVYALIFSRKNTLKVVTLSLSLFTLYIFSMIFIDQQNFFSRLFITFSRGDVQSYSGGIIESTASLFKLHPLRKWDVLYNYFFFLGIPGLFFIKGKTKWLILIAFTVITLAEFKFRGFWHYINSFGFLLSIGLASLSYWLAVTFKKNPKSYVGAISLLGVVLISACLLLTTYQVTRIVVEGKPFGIDAESWYSPEPTEIEQAVAYINKNVSETDLVMRSSTMIGDFKGRFVNPNRVLAFEENVNNPKILQNIANKDWLEYDASYKKIKYFVDDGFYQGWLDNKDQVKILKPIYDNWPCVFTAGKIKIYQNPAVNSELLQNRTADDIPAYFLDSAIFNPSNPIQTFKRFKLVAKKSFWVYKKDGKLFADKIKNQEGYELQEDADIYVISKSDQNTILNVRAQSNPVWLYSPRLAQTLDAPSFIDSLTDRAIIEVSNFDQIDSFDRNAGKLGEVIVNGEASDDFATALALNKSQKIKIDLHKQALSNKWYLGEIWQSAFDNVSLSIAGKDPYPLDFVTTKRGEYLVYGRVVNSGSTRSPLRIDMDGANSRTVSTDQKEGFYWMELFKGQLNRGNHILTLSNASDGNNDVDEIYVVEKNLFEKNLRESKEKISGDRIGYVYSAVDLANNTEGQNLTQYWSGISTSSYPGEANSLTLNAGRSISLDTPELSSGEYEIGLNLGKIPINNRSGSLELILNGRTIASIKASALSQTSVGAGDLKWSWFKYNAEMARGTNKFEIRSTNLLVDINLLTLTPKTKPADTIQAELDARKINNSWYEGEAKSPSPFLISLDESNQVNWRARGRRQELERIECDYLYQCFISDENLDEKINITSPDILTQPLKPWAVLLLAVWAILGMISLKTNRPK